MNYEVFDWFMVGVFSVIALSMFLIALTFFLTALKEWKKHDD